MDLTPTGGGIRDESPGPRDEASLRALVEASREAWLVVDASGLVVFANQQAGALSGRAQADLVGRRFADLLRSVGHRSSGVEVRRPDGAVHTADMSVTDLTWEGRPARLVSLRDTSDQRALEARLMKAERLAAIGQLAAGVAHEVNNPAAYVLTNLSLMRDNLGTIDSVLAQVRATLAERGQLDALAEVEARLTERGVEGLLGDTRDMLGDSLEGISRVSRIVKDLRIFSRLEADDVEEVDLNDVVASACNVVHSEIRQRGRLVRDLSPLPKIAAHRARISQLVVNLLLNACEAIDDGAPHEHRIRVTTWQEQRTVHLAVGDSGAGIAEEHLGRLFEPFFSTRDRRGSGLGLSIAADIAVQHGGEIHVSSRPGRGSRFELVLPRDTGLSAPGGDDAAAEPAGGAREDEGPTRVLIVDDEPGILTAYRRVLKRSHDVVTVDGGAEAIELLLGPEGDGFHAVVCDLIMPDVDGRQVYEELQARAPHLAARVIFCSGGAFTPRARAFLGRFDNPFLEKPVHPDLLRNTIDLVIEATRS